LPVRAGHPARIVNLKEVVMTNLPMLRSLRLSLLADAGASGATAALLVAGAGLLEPLLGLPLALMREAGMLLIPYAGARGRGIRRDPICVSAAGRSPRGGIANLPRRCAPVHPGMNNGLRRPSGRHKHFQVLPLERDDFSSNRHPALSSSWSMMFLRKRYPLFGIMLYPGCPLPLYL
jgi:hypothetical protein